MSTTTAGAGALDATRDRLLAGAEQAAESRQKAKIEKAGMDFESILLGSWLGKAESSFGSVPGGDDADDDEDSGKDQYQGIAMQALGSTLAHDGGIGIAKTIIQHLEAAQAQGAATSNLAHSGTEKAGVTGKNLTAP